MTAIKQALLYGVFCAVVATVLASVGIGDTDSIGSFTFGGIAGYLSALWTEHARRPTSTEGGE